MTHFAWIIKLNIRKQKYHFRYATLEYCADGIRIVIFTEAELANVKELDIEKEVGRSIVGDSTEITISNEIDTGKTF